MLNVERSTFRLWCAAAFAWAVGYAWLFDMPRSLGAYSAPWCRGTFDDIALVPVAYAALERSWFASDHRACARRHDRLGFARLPRTAVEVSRQ